MVELLEEASRSAKSVALRAIIETYQFRMLETTSPSRTSVALHLRDQEQQPVDSIPCDEVTLYAAMFCLGVRGQVSPRLPLLQSSKVILAAFEANEPTFDAMLYEWIIRNHTLIVSHVCIFVLQLNLVRPARIGLIYSVHYLSARTSRSWGFIMRRW